MLLFYLLPCILNDCCRASRSGSPPAPCPLRSGSTPPPGTDQMNRQQLHTLEESGTGTAAVRTDQKTEEQQEHTVTCCRVSFLSLVFAVSRPYISRRHVSSPADERAGFPLGSAGKRPLNGFYPQPRVHSDQDHHRNRDGSRSGRLRTCNETG